MSGFRNDGHNNKIRFRNFIYKMFVQNAMTNSSKQADTITVLAGVSQVSFILYYLML